MAGNEDATTKFFEAVNESSDALIDAIRAGNDRGHRIAAAALQELQEGQRESSELFKRWTEAPLDIFGFYGAVIESVTKAQGRSLDVTRQWFNEMADVQKETRETLQRLINANRNAGEASADMARGVFSRTTGMLTARTNGAPKPAARQPAKTSES